MKSRTITSDLLLLLTALVWGFAFAFQRQGMEHIGPFLYNGIRFLLGSLVLVPFIVHRHINPENNTQKPGIRRSIPYGALAGVSLFLAASFQQVGIVFTTAGNAGFITGLYVIFVPFISLFWHKHSLHTGIWIGCVLSITGLYLLSFRDLSGINIGDLLVLVSALFWAVQIQLIDWLTTRLSARNIACIQFATVGILSLGVSAVLEPWSLPAIFAATIPILYGGFVSIGIGFTLQIVAQKSAHPAHASIIMCLEAVFAALGGWLLLGETLSAIALFGCSLMFTGMIISQVGSIKFFKKPNHS
jgi:drug/metabolite transporter (DMT)-like permease